MCELGGTGVEERVRGPLQPTLLYSTALQVLNLQQWIILSLFLLLLDFFKTHFYIFPLIIYVILEVKMHEAQS